MLPSFSVADLATLQEDDQLQEIWKLWTAGWKTEQQGSDTKVKPGLSGWIKEWSKIVEKEGGVV